MMSGPPPSPDFSDWINRDEDQVEIVSDRIIDQFHAAFGPHLFSVYEGFAPLGLHWCLMTPSALTTELTDDGHPPRGFFLPPVPLPRRMWAGGRLVLRRQLPIGKPIRRTSKVVGIEWKDGKSGKLCFVTVEHHYDDDGSLLISERQDIVYRDASTEPASPQPIALPGEPAGADTLFAASSAFLFRYSALTFNSHRIHYDKDYARDVEGYAGLVVQGPLQATLLLNHAARILGTAQLDFRFRSVAPLIGEQAFGLCHEQRDETLHCWTRGNDGTTAMKIEAIREGA